MKSEKVMIFFLNGGVSGDNWIVLSFGDDRDINGDEASRRVKICKEAKGDNVNVYRVWLDGIVVGMFWSGEAFICTDIFDTLPSVSHWQKESKILWWF